MMKETGYTIRKIAARCGMTAHTLRYYERVGLIQPVGRERNGHRRYSDQDEAWLRFLKSMRATNMPIREMLRYAALRESADNRAYEQRRILEEHRNALEEQIANLQTAHALLTHSIEDFRRMEAEADSLCEPQSQWATRTIAAST
jgi:DNA-binding transcriptional MerR regulator